MEHTKGELYVRKNALEHSIIMIRPNSNTGGYLLATMNDFEGGDAKANAYELVRRWSAFEEKGTVAVMEGVLQEIYKTTNLAVSNRLPKIRKLASRGLDAAAKKEV